MRASDPLTACAACGALLERKRFASGRLEDRSVFLKRRFCNRKCMGLGFSGRHVLPMREPLVRFVEKVTFTDDHWLWRAATTRDGYGVFNFGNMTSQAHRWAYQMWIGPIPDGMHIDHLCRVRACVRPDHLEAVTVRENLKRSSNFVGERIRRHDAK